MSAMLGRGITLAAIVVYLIVLFVAAFPSQAPARKTSTPDNSAPVVTASNPAWSKALPFKGAAMQIQRMDWIDKYKQSMDEIAALGLDTFSLVVDTRQETAESSHIYLDMRMTPTPDQLKD